MRVAIPATLLAAVILLMLGLMRILPALGAPPPDADPQLAPWFSGLRQPGSGASCCSTSDCRPVEYRITAAGYEVFIPESWAAGGSRIDEPSPSKTGEWLPVPPDKVLPRQDNPTGHGVVCYTPWNGIMCFVSAAET